MICVRSCQCYAHACTLVFRHGRRLHLKQRSQHVLSRYTTSGAVTYSSGGIAGRRLLAYTCAHAWPRASERCSFLSHRSIMRCFRAQ